LVYIYRVIRLCEGRFTCPNRRTMEIPSRYPRESGAPPPAIYIEESGRFDRSDRFGHPRYEASNFSPSSIPMSIPNNRRIAEDDAPPPLPPPRFLPSMAPPAPLHHDRFPSIDSNAGWDSARRDSESDHIRFRKQEVIRPHQRDEGYHSMNSNLSSIGYVGIIVTLATIFPKLLHHDS
jgi:hypothetical protein